ncbi:hypothetical protein EJB05_35454 [Eragrostis curvula]|uniref:Uncharacterized protein n=1 Tax=Eragrostis curvula TaxID=38414 RepID=A0A5J9U821_9POAL|nr:hypothetical protein EJB05_35454 [Eragrostis curvula]
MLKVKGQFEDVWFPATRRHAKVITGSLTNKLAHKCNGSWAKVDGSFGIKLKLVEVSSRCTPAEVQGTPAGLDQESRDHFCGLSGQLVELEVMAKALLQTIKFKST